MSNSLALAVKRDSCPLRRSFIVREAGSPDLTPLASLLRTRGSAGGKGGGLRLSLLLSLIWVTAKPPYSTTRVAAYWAELLDRPDPRGEGARAIRDALHELADRGFIGLNSVGARTTIYLCNEAKPFGEDGAPNLYEPPYKKDLYVPIPRSFWTGGHAGTLSGAGISMYLCALAMTRSDDPEFFISAEFFEEHYGISRSSRKRGLAELVDRGILTYRVEETVSLPSYRKVRRNVYRLAKYYRQPEAYIDPEEAKVERVAKRTRTRARGA